MTSSHASVVSHRGSWLSAAKTRAASLFTALGKMKGRLDRSLSAESSRKERSFGWIEQLEPRLVMSGADPVQFHIANNTGTAGLASDDIYLSMFGQVAGVGTVTFVFDSDGNAMPYQLGSGATATADFDATTKVVTSFHVASEGSGYLIAPNIVITGGGGTGATGKAVMGTGDSAGKVVGVTVVSGGSGYTSAPTVTITSDGNAPSVQLSALENGAVLLDSSLSITGARIYISNDPGTVQILGGAPTGPTTSNFTQYFDFVEFALNGGTSDQLVVDTSQVDATGFPITLSIDPPDPNFSDSGIYIDREGLFSNFRADVTNADDYIFTVDATDYRILSPTQAITSKFSAVTLLGSISDPQAPSGEVKTYSATYTLPQTLPGGKAGPTTGALSVGMVVSGPHLPAAVVIESIGTDGYTLTISSASAFTAVDNVYLNFYNVPDISLINFFDTEIDTFFRFYTKDNPLTLSSVANEVYTGYTQSVTKTNINGTQSDYAVLRMTGTGGPFDIYYPFFTTNTPSGKTPATDGLTPIGNVVQPPPSWWAYSPSGGAQLSMYEFPSQMAFGGDGVFNDSVFQYPEASQTTQAQILGNLENQIVVSINRGYSMALNTRMGTIAQTDPVSSKGTVTLTSGTTDGIEVGMYFSTFPLSQMMKVTSVDSTLKTIGIASLTSETNILPINESVMHFTTFFPEDGVWNEYAEFLHREDISLGGRAYALSYDDQGGYSTTLTSNFGDTPAKVQIDLVSWSTPPVNNLPTIGGLFTDSPTYIQDTPVTISALDVQDPDGTVTTVSFYLDTNFNGIIEPTDTLLGEGVKDGVNWNATITGDKFELGKNQILGQAKDSNDAVSTVAMVDIEVSRRVSLGRTAPQQTTSYKYVDDEGNNVLVRITGPGLMHLYFDESHAEGGDPTKIEVVGTNERTSALIFSVQKNNKISSSTGITSVGDIDIEGGIRRLAASSVNLDGNLTVVGHAGSILLNDVASSAQQQISLGGKSTQRSTIALGKVQDLNLITGATVTAFRAIQWNNKDLLTPDSFMAPAVGRFDITGTRSRGGTIANGNFEANLTITGNGLPANAINLKLLTISGDAPEVDWNIAGNAGVIKVNSFVESDVYVSGNLGKITANYAFDLTNLKVGGSIGTITTGAWAQGHLEAKALSTLNVTGVKASTGISALRGIFVGDIDLSGSSTKYDLNRVHIADAAAGDWNITGAINSVVIGSADELDVSSTGNIGRFIVKGLATDMTVTSSAHIADIRMQAWSGGGLNSNSVGSLLISGKTATRSSAAVRGDFNADVMIKAQGLTGSQRALGSAVINGTMNDSTVRIQGNVGVLSLWEMYESSVYVGLNTSQPPLTAPTLASNFVNTTATLGRLRLTSRPDMLPASSQNSVVAASLLGVVQTSQLAKAGAPPAKIQLVMLDDSKYVASTSLPSSVLGTIYATLTPVVIGD